MVCLSNQVVVYLQLLFHSLLHPVVNLLSLLLTFNELAVDFIVVSANLSVTPFVISYVVAV